MSEPINQSMPGLPGIHLGEIDHLPEELIEGLEERQEVLAYFASNPYDVRLWGYVASQVTEEEVAGGGQPEELRDIQAVDLIAFAQLVFDTPPEERYALTTQPAPNGKLWFDVLYGFHSPSGLTAITSAVDYQLAGLGRGKVDLAIDLGTGTGEVAEVLAQRANKTVGIDRSSALLEVATEKHPDIEFIEHDIKKLPFEDETVDIITSDCLKHSLDAPTAAAMYSEIARVLKVGGVYIDADWASVDRIVLSVHPSLGEVSHPDYHPELLKSFVTWRAVLQDMIVDTISGKFEKTSSLDMTGADWQAFKRELGLVESNYTKKGSFESQLATARMLRKDSTESAI